MTDQEINMAIAGACGWHCCDLSAKDSPHTVWTKGEHMREFRNLPNYPNDLNAMHAAEAGLLGHQMIRYQAELNSITTKNPHVSCWDLIHATARQRAIAFIKTLGLERNDEDQTS